jgi:D-amino-acid dehydrogenase
MATASCLRRDGQEVTVVDMRPPGEYCSSGNAGILSPGSCVPFGLPGNLKKVPQWVLDPLGPLAIRPGYFLRALPWLLRFQAASRMKRVSPIADALRALLKQTLDAWGPLAKWAGVPDLIRRTGYLVVYESEQAFRGDALAWKIRRDRGVVCEDLDAARLRELEPAVETLVVCAGVHSNEFSATLGSRVPLESQRGYHVHFENPTVTLRRPVLSGEGKYFATPMETGLRIAGTVEFAGIEAVPDYARAKALSVQAARMLPGLAGSNVTQWMGHRPCLRVRPRPRRAVRRRADRPRHRGSDCGAQAEYRYRTVSRRQVLGLLLDPKRS